MKQIHTMTMYYGDEYSDRISIPNGVSGEREICHTKHLKNGHTTCANGIRRHKVSRLAEPADHVSYPPSIEQLTSTSEFILDHISNGTITDTNEDMIDLCEQMNSIDMSMPNGHEVNGSIETRNESRTHENTFESVVVYQQDRDGDSLLHTALILLEATLAFIFIDIASSPNVLSLKNLMCQTPLHLATLVNLPEVVRRLIVGGAEVDSRDKDGHTPLHIACRDGLVHIVNHLLEPVRYQETKKNKYEIPYQKIPQDLSIRNYEGLTVLHLAAINNHLEVIEILIEKDIDINMKEGKAGWSILHYACERGNINLVRLLLRYKRCNINVRAYDGSSPFDLARDRGHELVCMTLAAAGAREGEDEYPDSD